MEAVHAALKNMQKHETVGSKTKRAVGTERLDRKNQKFRKNLTSK
jgi:hypothetical protein